MTMEPGTAVGIGTVVRERGLAVDVSMRARFVDIIYFFVLLSPFGEERFLFSKIDLEEEEVNIYRARMMNEFQQS